MLLELFTPLARDGRLRVEAAEAARQFAAANSGVTLSLIAQPEESRDLAMSTQVREAVLAGLLAERPGRGLVRRHAGCRFVDRARGRRRRADVDRAPDAAGVAAPTGRTDTVATFATLISMTNVVEGELQLGTFGVFLAPHRDDVTRKAARDRGRPARVRHGLVRHRLGLDRRSRLRRRRPGLDRADHRGDRDRQHVVRRPGAPRRVLPPAGGPVREALAAGHRRRAPGVGHASTAARTTRSSTTSTGSTRPVSRPKPGSSPRSATAS